MDSEFCKQLFHVTIAVPIAASISHIRIIMLAKITVIGNDDSKNAVGEFR
jgi:hypothetical protein